LSARTNRHSGGRKRRAFPTWMTHELPLAACLALIWILSDQPSLPGPGERGSLTRDVFNYGSHAAIYGIVGLLVWRTLSTRAEILPRWLVLHPRVSSAAFAVLYGSIDEWHQSFVPGRTASLWDALTDLAGASLALCLWPLAARTVRSWMERGRRAAPSARAV